MATLKELLAARNKAAAGAPVVGAAPGKEPAREETNPASRCGVARDRHCNLALAAGGLRDDGRELGAVDGQSLPDEWPGAGTGDFDWKRAYGAFSSELAIVVEPAPSGYAWLAVARKDAPGKPLLLARLPLHSAVPGETPRPF